jgi:hypothetical protein
MFGIAAKPGLERSTDYASYTYSAGNQQVADIRFPGGERQFGCLSLAGVISGATMTYQFWEVDTFLILE